ncbi:hypothetical protein [Plantactinospora sp. GCM10030261]|uniref:hypothetical protein n=1 Tax=Plantactinospora sp. GCM10030261 TaxID=3273420 RepID=UPI00360AA991
MRTFSDIAIFRVTRARNGVVVAILGVSLAAAPLGGPAAGSPAGASLAQTPPACSSTQPCRLSTGLPPSYGVHHPILTPDGDTVVFQRSVAPGIYSELYSVPVRGGADPVRLDPPQAPSNGQKMITPDGQRVLYVSERLQGRALFSVPINGPASAAVRLSPAILDSFKISPDGRLVTFQSTTWRVRAVPIAGPESRGVTLTPTPADSFEISSNSRNLVYLADGDGGETELFRVPLTLNPDPGQQPTRLSGPMVDGGGVHSFRLPVGDGPVVYSAAQETPNIRELYSVGFGGGNRTKLNVPLPFRWQVGIKNDHPHGFQYGYGISGDGRRVVYGIQSVGDTQHQLFSVPAAGPASASRRLDVDTADTLPPVFHITADSRRVVYPLVDATNGSARAFSVPIDGPAGAGVRVDSGGNGDSIQVSPDGQRVVFRMLILNQNAVLSAPVDEQFPSSDMIRLNGAEELTGSVVFDPLGQRVAYTANAVAGETDVFSSALGTHSRFNLTATLTADLIAAPRVSDQHAVYSAHVGDGYQLYSSRLVPGTSG